MTILAALVTIAILVVAGCERPPEGGEMQPPPAGEMQAPPDEEMGAPEGPETTTEATPEEGQEEMAWTITSTAFEDGETIPEKYTADGEDVSPPLTFEDVPEGTAEIALICHDPDAPREGGWTHWVVYGMAPDIGGLPESVPASATVSDPDLIQGRNSSGDIGYMGPAPPAGPAHRYQFRGYALSKALDLEPGATKDDVEAAMEGGVIGEAMLEGLYARD